MLVMGSPLLSQNLSNRVTNAIKILGTP